MKNNLIRLIAALTVLASIILSLSCGDQGANSNRSQNSDVTVSTSPTPPVMDAGRACAVVDLNDRAEQVRRRIEKNITDDDDLIEMYRLRPDPTDPTKPGTRALDFRVVPTAVNGAPGFLTVYVRGYGNKNNQMDDFVNTMENVMKQNCVHKVVFLPRDTSLLGDLTRSSGFEWHYCDYPQVACPNGQCANEPCPTLMPSNSPGSNSANNSSNANSNSNSNSSTNSNTVNSGG